MNFSIANAARDFAELIFPQHCSVCGSENPHLICGDCFTAAFSPPEAVCDRCGRMRLSGISGPDCSECHKESYGFKRARSLFPYEGLGRTLFLASKFSRDKRPLALRIASEAVSRRIGAKCAQEFFGLLKDGPQIVVEVPAFKPNWRSFTLKVLSPNPGKSLKGGNRTNFNYAAIIAAYAARAFKLPWHRSALLKKSDIPSQVGLTHTARMDNVKGAFLVNPGCVSLISGKTVLLADDLLTTGATASECARVLKRAGAAEVFALTLFSTVPRPETGALWELDLYRDDELHIPPPVDF